MSNTYFNWQFGRLAWAWGSYWYAMSFEDGSTYSKILGPLYWREKP